MKTTNGSLLHGSEWLDYCLNLTVMCRKRNPSKGLKYLLPIFAIFFLTSTSPNTLSTNHLPAKAQRRQSIASFQTSEVCNETMIKVNNETVQLELPKFDPNLGTLTKVEVTTDCTMMGEVGENEVTDSEYQLLLNINLRSQLPGQAHTIGTISKNYRKKIRETSIQASSFQEKFEAIKQVNEIITSNLNALVGSGNVAIPLIVDGLVNYQDAKSKISSNLKVKVCLKYIYE
ncbi:choice-of-anchor E domain-containing protein [Haliscomenobacter sp.]|uniref:choice-of-anchor E domain-containing protein n=1 Tax=Haliscomenobacter sp. TaxID=2717303 RepID=UPI0033650E3B